MIRIYNNNSLCFYRRIIKPVISWNMYADVETTTHVSFCLSSDVYIEVYSFDVLRERKGDKWDDL